MRTLHDLSSNDTIVCFDEDVFLQERNLIKFTHTDEDNDAGWVKVWTDLSGSSGSPLARYALDGTHSVVIDMTDYFRAFPSVTKVFVECQQDSPVEISVNVVGLINPMSVVIPSHSVDDLRIEPPTMVFKNPDYSPVVELMLSAGSQYDSVLVGDTEIDKGVADVASLDTGSTIYGVKDDTLTELKKMTLREMVCGHRYAVVKWVSAFGNTKIATWEVTEQKTNAVDSVSLIPLEGDYNTIKGREDSFSLFLDQLSAYDLWYYGDIICSSKVGVSMDGGTTFRQVEVTTKNISIPDGDAGKMNELKIAVNYRKYDAAIM